MDNIILINKSLTIDGKGHTIDSNKFSEVVTITSDNVVLKNIKFLTSPDSIAGTIYWSGNNGNMINCTIANEYLKGQRYYLGNGIHSTGENFKINNCTIEHNMIKLTGGNGLITNSSFSDGSEVQLYGRGNSINNSIFTTLGQILIRGVDNSIENCSFNVTRRTDGGINIIGQCCIKNCNFTKFLTNPIFVPTIYEARCVSVDILNCSFVNNGGGISVYPANLENTEKDDLEIINFIINNCSFANNTGSPISFSDMPLTEDDLYFRSYLYEIAKLEYNMNNCSFMNNTGYVYLSGNCTMSNCSFVNHTNSAIIIYESLYSKKLNREYNIIDCNFVNNSCRGPGGAIRAYGYNISLINSTFIDNNAPKGGTIYWNCNGGELINCTFVNNINCSQIDCANDKVVKISGCKFINMTHNNVHNCTEFIKNYVNLVPSNCSFNYENPIDCNVQINNTLKDVPINSPITFIIGDENNRTFNATLIDNVAFFNDEISNLNVGNWNVTAIFEGDDNYYPCNATFNVEVKPAFSTISLNGKNIILGLNTTLISNISDKDAIPITEGIVTFFDNNKKIESVNVINGSVTLNYLPSSAGEHNITANFDSSNYISSTNFILINVDKARINLNFCNVTSCYVKTPSAFVINATSNNRPVKEGEIKFYVDDVLVSSSKIHDGVANFKYSTNTTGTFKLTAGYEENENYLSSNSTISVIAKKILTTISTNVSATVYNGDKYLVATLKDSLDNPLTSAELTIILNGKTFNKTTNVNGQVNVSTNSLAPNIYVANIAFMGDAYYDNATASVQVTVKKATPKLTAKSKTFKKTVKIKKYSVILKNNKNKAMKKVKLSLKVKGKTYMAKTNSKGKATFKITKLTKKGTFKAKIKYDGSKYYNKVIKSVKIKIKK